MTTVITATLTSSIMKCFEMLVMKQIDNSDTHHLGYSVQNCTTTRQLIYTCPHVTKDPTVSLQILVFHPSVFGCDINKILQHGTGTSQCNATSILSNNEMIKYSLKKKICSQVYKALGQFSRKNAQTLRFLLQHDHFTF